MKKFLLLVLAAMIPFSLTAQNQKRWSVKEEDLSKQEKSSTDAKNTSRNASSTKKSAGKTAVDKSSGDKVMTEAPKKSGSASSGSSSGKGSSGMGPARKQSTGGSPNAGKVAGNAMIRRATVAEIQSGVLHFTNVVVDGQLTHQFDDRQFILSDSTGSIPIELTDNSEYNLLGEIALGADVRVLGVVKHRLWGDLVLEVVRMKVLSPSEIADL